MKMKMKVKTPPTSAYRICQFHAVSFRWFRRNPSSFSSRRRVVESRRRSFLFFCSTHCTRRGLLPFFNRSSSTGLDDDWTDALQLLAAQLPNCRVVVVVVVSSEKDEGRRTKEEASVSSWNSQRFQSVAPAREWIRIRRSDVGNARVVRGVGGCARRVGSRSVRQLWNERGGDGEVENAEGG